MRLNSCPFPVFHTAGMQEHFEWLKQLPVARIATFGCFSSEPFALMWMLDATEVRVVEKDEANLSQTLGLSPREELEYLKRRMPAEFEGRSVEFIVADMCMRVNELQSDYYDLAYCENVLYFMEPNSQELRLAITEMARVVKLGGWVIAVETKMGVEFQNVEVSLLGSIPVPVSDPIDISDLFESVGLVRASLENSPPWSYCYLKPRR